MRCRKRPRIDATTDTIFLRIDGYHWSFTCSTAGIEAGFETHERLKVHADVDRESKLCVIVDLSTFGETERLYVALWSCSGQAAEGGRGDQDLC